MCFGGLGLSFGPKYDIAFFAAHFYVAGKREWRVSTI